MRTAPHLRIEVPDLIAGVPFVDDCADGHDDFDVLGRRTRLVAALAGTPVRGTPVDLVGHVGEGRELAAGDEVDGAAGYRRFHHTVRLSGTYFSRRNASDAVTAFSGTDADGVLVFEHRRYPRARRAGGRAVRYSWSETGDDRRCGGSCGTARARASECEQGVVVSDAHVLARMELRAALAHDDRAGGDGLAAVRLETTALRVAVAAVASCALTLLMCHLRLDRLNPDAGVPLPVALLFDGSSCAA